MEEDPNKIPELSQEDHAEFRDRFVQVHPDVILIDAKEPHKKFVERLSRDFLIHGIVPFYEPAEIRTRADVIVVKSGLSRNAEDLLSISRADQPEPVTDVTTLFHRLHAFFMALEYLNICAFSRVEGPLKYLQELEQFRSECPGLPFLMAADRAIRKKIFRLLSEQRATVHGFLAGPDRGPEQPQITYGTTLGPALRCRRSSTTDSSSSRILIKFRKTELLLPLTIPSSARAGGRRRSGSKRRGRRRRRRRSPKRIPPKR